MTELINAFIPQQVLSVDAKTKTIVLLGDIKGDKAILSAEKSAFDVDDLNAICHPQDIKLDVVNTVYHKLFVAINSSINKPAAKYSLIYPATETHIKKHQPQKRRVVAETKALYQSVVGPYIQTKTGDRLDWVYNILDHKAETDRILFEDKDQRNGFILLPDLKWDGTTLSSLYVLALVHRRDIASLRDLNGSHIAFLQHIRQSCLSFLSTRYGIARDRCRMYVHYHPSYYHFHVHCTTTDYEAGEGQAIGQAWLLDEIIELLRRDGEVFVEKTMYCTLGESTELYQLLSNS